MSHRHISGHLVGHNRPTNCWSDTQNPRLPGTTIQGDRGMPKAVASCVWFALAVMAALPSSSLAQEPKPTTTSAPETEEEKLEHASRRQCAVALCSTLHNHKPDTGDVTCNVQKTWRKEILVKILSKGKVTWPWGYARCITDLKFDRATLIKSMTLPEFEAQFDTHNIRCELEGKKEKYEVKLQIQPKVTFKQGKAVKASLNWGKIEAPSLAKTALWSATAADNSFGVLQSTVVEDINEFIQTKCMEAKEEWQGK
jgi:hypothetical protein